MPVSSHSSGGSCRASDSCKSRDRRFQSLRVGEARLNLLERQRVAVVHEFFVELAVNPIKPRIQGIARVVVLVAFDSPVIHISVVSGQLSVVIDAADSSALAIVPLPEVPPGDLGAAMNVGVLIGVRRIISEGVRRSPARLPNSQPASLVMTMPAAMSCSCSPSKIEA